MDPDKTTPQTQTEESKTNEASPAEVSNAPPIEEPKADAIPQLGDVIQFDDGKWAGRRGQIYYRDVNRILILPVGGSSKLDSIPMIRKEEDGEIVKVTDEEAPIEGAIYEFDPELEANHIRLRKHPLNKFVYDQDDKDFFLQGAPFVVVTDLKPGKIVTTYKKDGSFGPTFTVKEVDEEEDTAVFVQAADGEEANEYRLEFDYRGIPLNEPFQYFTAEFPPSTQPGPLQEVSPEEFVTGIPKEELDEDEIEFLDDVEEVQVAVQVEAGTARGVEYTDAQQMSGMLTDLLKDTKLSDKERLNPRRIKKVKVLTEQLFSLRNDLVNYLPGGKGIEGTKQTSYTTVSDVLQEAKVPLARPVVNSQRSIYYDHTPKYFEELQTKTIGNVGSVDRTESENKDIAVHFLDEAIRGSIRYLKDNMTTSMSTEIKEQTSTLPQFYAEFQNYFSYFMPQFTIKDGTPTTPTVADMDVFRGGIPKTDDEIKTVGGLQKLNINREGILDSSVSQMVSSSRLRSITSRSGRIRSNELVTVENSDVLDVMYYLFFPFLYLREFGSTRTGDLALDIAQSMLPMKTMNMILEQNGPIQEREEGVEGFDPDKILPVRKDGSVLSNLSIADWLSGQPIFGRGIGDLLPLLTSLGLRNKDLNVEQMKMIVDKINRYNLALRTFLNNERTKAEEAAQKTTVQVNSLLDAQSVKTLIDKVWIQKSEGILPTALLEFAERVPAYKESDIARFAYLYKKYPDLFQDTLAGKPTYEYIRAARTLLLTKKRNELLAERMKKSAVGPPKPNPCEHVEQYTIIKNAKNLGDRMELLAMYVSKYRKEAKENHWIMCKLCDKHLLCEHEFLQIREFMDPLRAKQYHKELLLTFNDGAFMGHYICKNCGQGIQDVEYDSHLEYNDNGVPMIGRGTIADKDQEIKDEIERLLDTKPAAIVEEIKFEDGLEALIYKIMKRIVGVVGVDFEKDTFVRLVKRIKNNTILKKQADFVAAEDAKKKKDASYKKVTFMEYTSRVYIGTCAAAILVEVQTRVPEYVIEYTVENCVATFEGYPLDPSKEKNMGITYLSCGIATIQDAEAPWSATGFQGIKDPKAKIQVIGQSVYNNMNTYMKIAATLQELEEKRKYLTDKYGRAPGGKFTQERIPDGFTPPFLKITKEEAAKQPIQEIAARGSSRVSGWLMAAHILARAGTKTSTSTKKSLLTCCYNEVSTPMKYWMDKKLPDFGDKEVPKGTRGAILRIPMKLREERELLGSVDDANMKKLFSKVCFRGPRLGYPHEPGYDMKCPYCELTFLYDPRDPVLPLITQELRDKKYSYGKMIEKGIEEAEKDLLAKKEQALTNAGVVVNLKSFNELLDTMHEHYLVPKVIVKRITTVELKLLEELRDIQYAPFGSDDEYKRLLNQTIENLREVMTKKGGNDVDYINAYEPIILKVNELSSSLSTLLEKKYFVVFSQMFKGIKEGDSYSKLAQALLSYYLLPFQRAVTKFNKAKLVEPPTSLKLGPQITQDITKYLNDHIVENTYFEPEYTSTKKLKDAVNKLKVLIPIMQNKIRLNTFPGQLSQYPYLASFLVLGIFADLLDPDVLPSEYDESNSMALSEKDKAAPLNFMKRILEQKNKENLDFTDEGIRSIIEQRNEEERQAILGRFKKLPDSLKPLESEKKKLRIGDWAVGGSK